MSSRRQTSPDWTLMPNSGLRVRRIKWKREPWTVAMTNDVAALEKMGAKVKFCLHGDGRYEMMIVEWPKPIPLLRRSDDQGQTWHDALR